MKQKFWLLNSSYSDKEHRTNRNSKSKV